MVLDLGKVVASNDLFPSFCSWLFPVKFITLGRIYIHFDALINRLGVESCFKKQLYILCIGDELSIRLRLIQGAFFTLSYFPLESNISWVSVSMWEKRLNACKPLFVYFSLILLFLFLMGKDVKMLKKTTLNSKQRAKQPFTGQNTQHRVSLLPVHQLESGVPG